MNDAQWIAIGLAMGDIIGWIVLCVYAELDDRHRYGYLTSNADHAVLLGWLWPLAIPFVIIGGFTVVLVDRIEKWRTRSK